MLSQEYPLEERTRIDTPGCLDRQFRGASSVFSVSAGVQKETPLDQIVL
jgi:hypothetical protein